MNRIIKKKNSQKENGVRAIALDGFDDAPDGGVDAAAHLGVDAAPRGPRRRARQELDAAALPGQSAQRPTVGLRPIPSSSFSLLLLLLSLSLSLLLLLLLLFVGVSSARRCDAAVLPPEKRKGLR